MAEPVRVFVSHHHSPEEDAFTAYTVPTKFTMSTQFPISGGTQRRFFHRTIPDRNTTWTMEFTCPKG